MGLGRRLGLSDDSHISYNVPIQRQKTYSRQCQPTNLKVFKTQQTKFVAEEWKRVGKIFLHLFQACHNYSEPGRVPELGKGGTGSGQDRDVDLEKLLSWLFEVHFLCYSLAQRCESRKPNTYIILGIFSLNMLIIYKNLVLYRSLQMFKNSRSFLKILQVRRLTLSSSHSYCGSTHIRSQCKNLKVRVQ